MKEGVILAGGKGTRLGHNRPYNKHLSLVYDRPMIEYPLATLRAMGVEKAQVVVPPDDYWDFLNNYPHKVEGVRLSYRTQAEAKGSADALGKTMLKGVFPVLCGDVYFDPAPHLGDNPYTDKQGRFPEITSPTLFWTEFEGAQNHSVWNAETNEIIEKPKRDIGKRAIVAYVYDERVYDVIKTLKPTERGELELIDLHNWYLQNGAEMVEYKGFFGDMGTPDGLLRVANHVKGNS